MTSIHYLNGEASLDGVLLKDIANEFGTPCYVYSSSIIENQYKAYADAFQNVSHQVCYAVKANSNLSILKLLNQLGSGFDIVSEGELARVLAAGGEAQKIVFSGVGKLRREIEAGVDADIYCFNVESENELERIQAISRQKRKIASISLRINPNIDPKTHPYIATGLKNNKFGIELNKIPGLFEQIKKEPYLELIGIACHIGSQLLTLEPFSEVVNCLRDVYEKLSRQGAQLEHINLGGGLGVRYHDEIPPTPLQYASLIKEALKGLPIKIILEPGRSIIAESGLLLTRVEYLKYTSEKNFAIVDAAMNDLIRPALYQAWQDIIPITQREVEIKNYDIVGPVCESSDYLGQNRKLGLKQDDLLAVLTTGAYGFCMSSNYNSRKRPPEVMIDRGKAFLIRKRETIEDILGPEQSFL